MPDLENILSEIGDESIAAAKTELIDLFNQAKAEQFEFAQETADKTKKWLEMRVKGEINNEEFLALLESRKRVIQQNLNTLEIQSRARLEKILFGIIDIITDKILDKII
jgi:hypothetical protein